MIKKLSLCALLLFLFDFGYAQTHYMTVRVSMQYKNKIIKHIMVSDIGTAIDHPLKGKISNTENGSVMLKENDTQSIVLNSDVELITYFDNHGWDLVSVNEVMLIENKQLQYLFKTE